MATKYSDIIQIRPGRPAYSIEEEKNNEWRSFIPNEQFNNVLRTVLKSVRGNDIDVHKSFWINGTYGTGKSHAASVISHILCDPLDEIKEWIDLEYGDEKYKLIRDSIYSLRKGKRLLRVKLETLKDITHVSELAPVIQTSVVDALKEKGLEITVDTDYDSFLTHVTDNPEIWDYLINRNVGLSTIVANRGMLIKKLSEKDPATLQKSKVALREARINVMLEQDSLPIWLEQVQEELRRDGQYQGLLIVWDEFTDVMNDSVGIPVLKELQTVAQKFMSEGNDSFLFLISHPSAFNKLGVEDTKQTDGRYHRMKYNMESVSAFKIMSRKFNIVDKTDHLSRVEYFYRPRIELLDLYTKNSNNREETRRDLCRLFPLHPATANLATHYATVVGSSTRSVFEFLGQNDAIKEFLESSNAFLNRHTITADYLWDFIFTVFQDDVRHYGAVTERFNTYRHQVEHEGAAYFAIFKGILLLNAFNNVASDESVTPTEDNIIRLFEGSQYEEEVESVLTWFNDRGIIQKDPSGVYSVQFNALPSHELEELKESLYNSEFRYTSQILKFGETARTFFDKKYLQKVLRPYIFEFYSEDSNDSILRNKIKTAKKNTRPSDLFIALLYARDNRELEHLRQFAKESSILGRTEDKELKDVIYFVADSTFGEKSYDRFIEYMASYKSAGNHGFNDQANVHRDHAIEMIKDWMQTALRGNASIYINGNSISLAVKHLSRVLNVNVSPLIYPLGPDTLEILRSKSPSTFWKPQVSKEIIRTFIFGTSKSDLLNVSGVMKPIQYFIQDAIDENLEWKHDIPENHQFKAIYDFINSTIKNFISHGNTSQPFDFTERFTELTQPPFGLSANYASGAAVAFAMRPWIDKIYDKDTGKPRSADNLAEDIVLLFNYWEKGKATNKLSFKFQTPQENRLCKEIVKLFKLNKLPGYSDISSMKDARFAITGVFVEQKGYPLWSLKYMSETFTTSFPPLTMNDDIKKLIDNIVAICEEKDQKNVQLITGTLDLINRYRIDFANIITREGAFKNGFEHFLLTQNNVGLHEDELEDAHAYITKHLESTIGFWTEAEVKDKLKDWRISENDRLEQERRDREEEERQKREEEQNLKLEEERKRYEKELAEARKIIGNPANVPVKKITAKERIDQIKDPEQLRSILGRLINLGYEYILDQILDDNA